MRENATPRGHTNDMTGFDPTAPERDTDRDEPEKFPDNVVPPDALTDDDVPATGSDETDRDDDE